MYQRFGCVKPPSRGKLGGIQSAPGVLLIGLLTNRRPALTAYSRDLAPGQASLHRANVLQQRDLHARNEGVRQPLNHAVDQHGVVVVAVLDAAGECQGIGVCGHDIAPSLARP